MDCCMFPSASVNVFKQLAFEIVSETTVRVCVCVYCLRAYACAYIHIEIACLFLLVTWIVMSPSHRLHAARMTPNMCAGLEGRGPT